MTTQRDIKWKQRGSAVWWGPAFCIWWPQVEQYLRLLLIRLPHRCWICGHHLIMKGKNGRKIIKCTHNNVVEVKASALFWKSAFFHFGEVKGWSYPIRNALTAACRNHLIHACKLFGAQTWVLLCDALQRLKQIMSRFVWRWSAWGISKSSNRWGFHQLSSLIIGNKWMDVLHSSSAALLLLFKLSAWEDQKEESYDGGTVN